MKKNYFLKNIFIISLSTLLSSCVWHNTADKVDDTSLSTLEVGCAHVVASSYSLELTNPLESTSSRSALIQSESDIAVVLASMTLKEKVGQMVQTDIAAITPQEIKENYIGSVISTIPKGDLQTTQQWRQLADSYQQEALKTPKAIPLVFGIDAVHGHSYFDGSSVILPHNIGLGATRNPQLVKQLAQLTAKELSATGVHWTFSPTIAVARNIRWGRTYESFGETPELQKMFAVPMVEGYQGSDLSAIYSVGATAKHFIADGATANGIDRGNAQLSNEELRRLHMSGFIDAIERDVVSVMASFSSVNGEKVHGSKLLLTDLLKDELGFKGVVISDWEGIDIGGLTLIEGLNAGIDMFMFAQSWRVSMPRIIEHVQKGEIPMSRIDDAVARILTMKFKLGLFERSLSSDACAHTVGSKQHRDLAKQAVRESLVLLKNEKAILPLNKQQKVVVVGSHANNIPYQCGGWTKKWQGAHHDRFNNPARPVDGATSIIDGIRGVVGADNIIDAGVTGFNHQADVAIIVVGETPYAEGFGDREANELVLSEEHIGLIKKYHDAGIKIVTVLISGRPLLVSEQIDQSAAFVAAWLPGSEGRGIAEVLFGDYNFTGKLGFSWPKNASQIPLNIGDEKYDPLFEYGFGLSY
jgi:beta-glucosidase